MAKVRFNINVFDAKSKKTYEASDIFQEVPNEFVERLKAYQKGKKEYSNAFEFEPTASKTPKAKTPNAE